MTNKNNKYDKKSSFKLVSSAVLEELETQISVYIHEITGTECVFFSNKDTNKSLTIGLRTLNKEDYGVAHILEHSVLAGSKKYPLKDPFKSLINNSLKTFLNASTYEDRTLYPVGSENNKDFKNLADVYFDAVFHPLLTKKTFSQEGWHYEYDKKSQRLKYGGVVFNEMKGASGNGSQMILTDLSREIYKQTHADYAYGGDPLSIPNLTYKDFVEFHKTFYNPSNAKFVFYGDMDIPEYLDFLEERLEGYKRQEVKTIKEYHRADDANFNGRVAELEYPVSLTEENLESKLYYFEIFRLPEDISTKVAIAWEILEYILIKSDGAFLRKVLMESGLVEDIYEDAFLLEYEHAFIIGSKHLKRESIGKVKELIVSELRRLVKAKIDKAVLLSAINIFNYEKKEVNGYYDHKGINITAKCFSLWNHFRYEGDIKKDDGGEYARKISKYIRFGKELNELKEMVEAGSENYFEDLIEKYILGNENKLSVIFTPSTKIISKRDEQEENNLKDRLQQLSKKDLEKIVNFQEELKKYQETPDSEEVISMLPRLSLSDISQETKYLVPIIEQINQDTMLKYFVSSNGVVYLRLALDVTDILVGQPEEFVNYFGLLSSLLFKTDLEKLSYTELNTQIELSSGGVSVDILHLPTLKGEEKSYLIISTKTLPLDLKKLLDLITLGLNNILLTKKRLLEIINMQISSMEEEIISLGHVVVLNRSLSKVNTIARLTEMSGGLQFIIFLKKIREDLKADHYSDIENKIFFMLEKLKLSRMTIAYGSSDKLEYVSQVIGSWLSKRNYVLEDSLQGKEVFIGKAVLDGIIPLENEFIPISSQVNYVGQSFLLQTESLDTKLGVLRIFQQILNYSYLWEEIRVKGGAYGLKGVPNAITKTLSLGTYRDPNLERSLEVFLGVPEFIKKYVKDTTEKVFEGNKIASFGRLDMYQNPASQVSTGLIEYLQGINRFYREEERKQLFLVKKEDLLDIGELIEKSIKGCENRNIAILGAESRKESIQKDTKYNFRITKY